MDKVTLTKDELKQLVAFIHSRGFREPLVVMDILDHFACKVEEKLAAIKGLSLEQAMEDAHRDFGVTGFRKLAVSTESQLHIRHEREYKRSFMQHLKNIPLAALILLLGICFYKGYMWADTNTVDVLWGNNLLVTALWLVFIAGTVAVQTSMPKRYLKASTGTESVFGTASFIAFIMFFTSATSGVATMGGMWPALYCSAVFVYLILHFLAEYKTINKIFENYKELEDMLASIEH